MRICLLMQTMQSKNKPLDLAALAALSYCHTTGSSTVISEPEIIPPQLILPETDSIFYNYGGNGYLRSGNNKAYKVPKNRLKEKLASRIRRKQRKNKK